LLYDQGGKMENATKYVIVGGAIIIIALILGLTVGNVFSGRAYAYASSTQNQAAVNSANNANGNPVNGNVNGNTANSNTASAANGDVQTATIKVSGSSYIITPSVFKKGVPVRLVADMSTFVGCSRGVVIPAFGVNKYLSATDNVIEFTPTQSGTIKIACTMNMYRGTFTVTDDGTASSASAENVQQSPVQASGSGGTCGANGGGCGCGARA